MAYFSFCFITGHPSRYHDHGDTIAIQYGGSHLVNTMETYRKINQWSSHSRDMVESFKRYYNNSFLDRQRQEAYNLFLGNYIFDQGQPLLWDLSTDYYLHHAHPRAWAMKHRKSYVHWYTPENLERRRMPGAPRAHAPISPKPLEYFDNYWLEYYRPLAISTFGKILTLRLNSTLRYIPLKLTQDGKYDLSPFRVRSGNEHESPEKERTRKDVSIVESNNGISSDASAVAPSMSSQLPQRARPDWVDSQPHLQSPSNRSNSKDTLATVKIPSTMLTVGASDGKFPKDKSTVTQWTLDQFVANSLDPSVADSEADEYQRYINHPLNLPLVISTETPPSPNMELLNYINSNSLDAVTGMHSTEDDIADYNEFVFVGDDPLTVTDADPPKKRYKAYRQWLKGRSLFKQQRVDP
jgi:phosphatidylinositol 3,5-bisphosphate 5-phosphatase